MLQASFFSSRAAQNLALILIFGLAFAIRLYDLTDLPLDFHPTRQLVSAIKTRALYYKTRPEGITQWQFETAIRQAKLKADVEPVVIERLVAFTYRFTGEQLWIARIYSSLFWLIGGIFLFLLLRDFVSFEGALFSTAYYLFFPYAVIASRSFQPDPVMVMLILSFWWMFARWMALTMNPSRKWSAIGAAILAGLFGGFAIFIKFSAVFFVIGGALGLALSRVSLRDLLRNAQVWIIVLLGVLPASVYLVHGLFIRSYLRQQFGGRFIPALLLSPLNYLQWEVKASLAAGGIFIMLGLLGLVLTKDKRVKIFLFGLWGAYLCYGLFFDYHVATHDYYHLPLIPIVAASLASFGDWFFARLAESPAQRGTRSVIYVILIYGLLSVMLDVRNQLKSVDYRPEAVMWAKIGERLGQESRVVALTQDYGSRLQYWGWTTAAIWPSVGDINYMKIRGDSFSFNNLFKDYSSDSNFFLVTDFDEFERQLRLKKRLFKSYPVYAQGDGYLIFDLRNPLRDEDTNGS